MPIYEYECGKCGHEFEREQRMSDPPVKICPECKSRKVRKLISRSSFVLKGGGWYSDGYSDAKPDAKSDAKPDAKPGSGKGDGKESAGAPGESTSSSGSSGKSDQSPTSDASAKSAKSPGKSASKSAA